MIIKNIIKLFIYGYKVFISPLAGVNCRFTPSCSSYAIEAINLHGAYKGSFLAIKRLLHCHPFSKKVAEDPVPMPDTYSTPNKKPKTP